MNILYVSVHQILETDEVTLFKSLGHDVMCLGANNIHGTSQPFRPRIDFNEREAELYKAYEEKGGAYLGCTDPDKELPSGFAELFDLIVVMHSVDFIAKHWPKLSKQKVVWRTIGLEIEHLDTVMTPFRNQGMRIVRYSPIEANSPSSCGQDAIIRFYKNPDVYGEWNGNGRRLLSFANRLEYRYPDAAHIYRELAETFPCSLGGMDNESLPGSIGLVSYADQITAYRNALAYLYLTGHDIPYTLNFIEAWMTGIPVIVYAPEATRGAYYEIDRLVTHKVSGFICRSVSEIVDACSIVFRDRERACDIGRNGRAAAIRYFGLAAVAKQWSEFFDRVQAS